MYDGSYAGIVSLLLLSLATSVLFLRWKLRSRHPVPATNLALGVASRGITFDVNKFLQTSAGSGNNQFGGPRKLSSSEQLLLRAVLESLTESRDLDVKSRLLNLKPRQPRVTIQSLPPEILAEVFQHLSFDAFSRNSSPLHRRVFGNGYSWTAVLRVCQHWRSVAEANPHLWTHVTTSYRVEDIDRLLTMSKSADIIAKIAVAEPGLSDDLRGKIDLLLTHYSRFSKLQVTLRKPEFHHDGLQRALGTLNAPHLSSLYIEYGMSRRGATSPLSTVVLDRSRFPSVENVEFRGYAPSWKSTIFQGLTSLQLKGISEGITLSELLDILKSCPRLAVLGVDHSTLLGSRDARAVLSQIELPLLRILRLKMDHQTLLSFFRYCRLPDTLERHITCFSYRPGSMSAFPLAILGGSDYPELKVFFTSAMVEFQLYNFLRSFGCSGSLSFHSVAHMPFISDFDFRGLFNPERWTSITRASFMPIFGIALAGVVDAFPYADVLSAMVNLVDLSFTCAALLSVRRTGHAWLRKQLEAFVPVLSCTEPIVSVGGDVSQSGIICAQLKELEISVPFGCVGDEESFWKLLFENLQSRIKRGGSRLQLTMGGFIMTAEELATRDSWCEAVEDLDIAATDES